MNLKQKQKFNSREGFFRKSPFLYFFLHKSWIWRTLEQVMDIFCTWHFHNVSKVVFWPKRYWISCTGSKHWIHRYVPWSIQNVPANWSSHFEWLVALYLVFLRDFYSKKHLYYLKIDDQISHLLVQKIELKKTTNSKHQSFLTFRLKFA